MHIQESPQSPSWCQSLGPESMLANIFNTLRPQQNGHHFAHDIMKGISLNENVRIWIIISLNFVHKGPIDNFPALVQIMAWRRSGNKPLSEPMMVKLPTHAQPQWVNSSSAIVPYVYRTYSRLVLSQWEMALLCKDVSDYLCPSLESASDIGKPLWCWSGNKPPVGSPSMGTLMMKTIRSCKSFGGQVKLGFSMWIPHPTPPPLR